MAKHSMRRFLNTEAHGGMASVWGTTHDPNDYGQLNGSLVISDCNHSITLELTVYDEDSLNNAFHKLWTLVEVTKRTITEMEARVPEWRKLKAAYEKRRKEETDNDGSAQPTALLRRPRRRRRASA